MTLLTKIKDDIRRAILDKNEIKRDILRVVVGELNRKHTEGNDTEVIKTIKKIIEGNNELFVYSSEEKLRKENEILNDYLPKMLSKEKITSLLSKNYKEIKEAKAEGIAIGMAMKELKASGVAVDGNDVKEVVITMRNQ